MKQKFKLLILPYIIIVISLTIVYITCCWILFIKFKVAEPDEDLINFWIPFTLPWLPTLIWLRPKIKKLKLKRTGSRSPDFGFMMVAALSMAAPIMVAVTYLGTATGKLTSITNVSQIKNNKPTKFYSIKNYAVDKAAKVIYYSSEVTGRYSSQLNLYIYIACPLYDKNNIQEKKPTLIKDKNDTATYIVNDLDSANKDPLILIDGIPVTKQQLSYLPPDSVADVSILKGISATALYGKAGKNGVMIISTKRDRKIIDEEVKSQNPDAWLGVVYEKDVSNNSSSETKKNFEHEFYNDCMQKFEDSNLYVFNYFKRIGNNKKRTGLKNAIIRFKPVKNTQNLIILEPEKGDYITRTGNELPWMFGAFTIALFVWTIMVMIPKIETNTASESTEKISKSPFFYLNFLIPNAQYYITPLIIDINLTVFFIMVISGLGFINFDAPDLLKWGAIYQPYISAGEWWRLLTNLFVHAGFIHLFSNMLALFFIGIILEPIIGKKAFALSYITCGCAASITSFCWHDNIVSVGASGAIFGLYGIFLALLIMKTVIKYLKKTFLTSTIFFIAYNIIMGFANSVIDNAAHIGGLVCGLLIGFYIATSGKQNENNDISEINKAA